MARRADAIAENAEGELFVDSSCIDCDLCRQLAPAVFARSPRRGQSYVTRQPGGDAERHRALMALVTCPTSSIGTTTRTGARAAAAAFPEPVFVRRRFRAASPDAMRAELLRLARTM